MKKLLDQTARKAGGGIDNEIVGLALDAVEHTDQATLGATDSGPIEKEPQMSGQPQPTWVGNALAVNHKEVRRLAKLADGLQANRGLAKR